MIDNLFKILFFSMSICFCFFNFTEKSFAQTSNNSETPYFDIEGRGGLVRCGRTSDGYEGRCTLCDLIVGIQRIIKWGMQLLVVVALVAIVAGGIMYIISAGNSGMMESAKTVIKQALWGVVIVLGAWVIVNTILWMITSKLYPGTGEEGNKFMDISNWYNFDCEPAVSIDIVRCEMGFGSNPEGTQCVRCSDIGADVHATRPGECLIPCLNGSVRDSTGSCIWNCPAGSHPYPNYDAIGSDNNSGICLDDVTGEIVPSIQSSQSITPQPETPPIPQPETPTAPQPELPVPPSESTTIPQGEQAVRSLFSEYGILINNDPCQSGQTGGCTDVGGLRDYTTSSVVALKESCGANCETVITGGSEGNGIHNESGTYNHINGYKVDLRPNPELNNYIETNYTKIPEPRSDGAIGYRDFSGNTYYLEGNHWDVTYLGT